MGEVEVVVNDPMKTCPLHPFFLQAQGRNYKTLPWGTSFLSHLMSICRLHKCRAHPLQLIFGRGKTETLVELVVEVLVRVVEFFVPREYRLAVPES